MTRLKLLSYGESSRVTDQIYPWNIFKHFKINLYFLTNTRLQAFTTNTTKILINLNNLKRDPLEIQHPKFENSRLGFTEPVHER